MNRLLGLVTALLLVMSFDSAAVTPPPTQNVGYYGFEPDIVTNYVSTNNKKIGFVRVTVELMLEDVSYIPIVEHHAPLLRAAIVDIFVRQPEQKIKSMTGREEIRTFIIDKLREIMKQETKQPIIKDVLFAKYLYH